VATMRFSQSTGGSNRRRGWANGLPLSAASSRIPLEEKLRRKQERQRRYPEMTKLEELKKRAARAVGRAKARERRLYQFGQPLFPEDKHRELLAEIRAERNAILNEIRREVQEISAEGRRTVDLLQEFPRDSILNAIERSELGDRLDLIRSEFERVRSPQQIARKLEALHEHGSKVERFAAWMAVNERRRALEEKGQEYAHMAFVKEFEALDRGLFEQAFMERTAGPAATVNAAEELAMFCYTRARDAQSMAGAYGNERYSVTPLIEKQRYEHGGRVPVSAPGGHEPPTGQVAS
jgi:hypothetical protein